MLTYIDHYHITQLRATISISMLPLALLVNYAAVSSIQPHFSRTPVYTASVLYTTCVVYSLLPRPVIFG